MFFYSILSNMDDVLSIKPSANVFVFGDFNVHHKDWVTYSGGTDKSDTLCYNFSISNNLTRMAVLLRSQTVILIVLLFWIYLFLDTSVCSTMAFPPVIMLLSQFLLTFHNILNSILHFIALLMTILVLIGTVFLII